jgi:hypothetical protein
MSTSTDSLTRVPAIELPGAGGGIATGPKATPNLPIEQQVEGVYTRAVVSWRWWSLSAVVVVLLASMNGQWRAGADSAQYLGIAKNLAEGRGYTFGGVQQDLIYPGLPALLAGLRVMFGESYWPAVIMMTGMALTTLVILFALIRLYFPTWVAVCVVVGTAFNERFIQLSQEMMTDMPFLLGTVASLYGVALLRDGPKSRRTQVVASVVLVLGLALAASMRPTFWLLAIAWTVVSVYGLLFTEQRRFHAISLVVLFAVWAAVVAVDPRVNGMNPAAGGYERMFMAKLGSSLDAMLRQSPGVLARDFPAAFFGETMGPLGPVMAIVLLVGLALVARRQPMWGMYAGITVLVTLMFDFTSTPRYYLPILPVLWLGWVLVACHAARWFAPRWRNVALAGGVLLALCSNIGGVVSLLVEQRHPQFHENYKRGQMIPIFAIAEQIKTHTPAEARVVGPFSTVLTYLSDRQVMGADALLGDRPVTRYFDEVRQYDPDYMVFPVRFYRARDERLVPILERRLITAGEVIAESGEIYLARPAFKEVEGDWRQARVVDRDAPPKKPPAPAKKKEKKPAAPKIDPNDPAVLAEKWRAPSGPLDLDAPTDVLPVPSLTVD